MNLQVSGLVEVFPKSLQHSSFAWTTSSPMAYSSLTILEESHGRKCSNIMIQAVFHCNVQI
eukprot:6714-Amphidinium_carterae.1